jgi:S1-C subfamily serine protease
MKNNKRKILWLGLIIPFLAFACTCGLFAPSSPSPTPTVPIIHQEPTPAIRQQPAVAPAILTSEDNVLVDLYTRVNPSVVNIITYSSLGQNGTSNSQGSGFVFDLDGHIVTNAHVVHGSDSVEVVFSDDTISSADIVGEDLNSDLAVLKVESLPSGVQALPLGDINNVAVGQTVVAIGNPFGLGGTLTKGIVSAMGRTIPALTQFSIPQSIQTDAPINPGNSGGPLLNLQGEVIGVNAQIETNNASNVNSGVGFAIPVSIVSRVIPELISNGKYEWAWLGVAGGSVNPPMVDAMHLPVTKGAYISEVVAGGPSDKAGLRGTTQQTTVNGRLVEIGGDVITAIDGQPVASFEDLLIYIALDTTPGQKVALTVVRNGQTQDISVTLGTRPEQTIEFFPTFP